MGQDIGTGQAEHVKVCVVLKVTDGEIHLARSILAVPYQLSVQGLTVTQSWRRSNSVFGPSKL